MATREVPKIANQPPIKLLIDMDDQWIELDEHIAKYKDNTHVYIIRVYI